MSEWLAGRKGEGTKDSSGNDYDDDDGIIIALAGTSTAPIARPATSANTKARRSEIMPWFLLASKRT